jgi:hypothetical protein
MGWLKRKDIFRFFIFPRLPSTIYIFNLEEGRRTGNQVYGVSWQDPETIVSIPVKLRGMEQDVIEELHFQIDRGNKESEEDVIVLGGVRAFTSAALNEVPIGNEFSILRPFLTNFMIPWIAISYVILMLISGGIVQGGLGYFLLGLSLFAIAYPLVMFAVYTSTRPIRYIELLPVGNITGTNVIEIDGKLVSVEGEGVTIYTPSPNQVGVSTFLRRMRLGPIIIKDNEAALISRAGVKFVEAEMWKQKARSFALAAREGGVLSTPQQYLASLSQLSGSRLRRIALPLALIIMAVVIAGLVFILLQPSVAPTAPNAIHNVTTTITNVTTTSTSKPIIKVF